MSEFTAYQLNRIPLSLWKRVKNRAAKEGHTLRFLFLKFLQQYAEGK